MVLFMTATGPAAFACCPFWCLTILRPCQNSLNMAASAAVLGCERRLWQLFLFYDGFNSSGQTNIGRKACGVVEQTAQSDVWPDETFSCNIRIVSILTFVVIQMTRFRKTWGIRETDWQMSLFLWMTGLQVLQISWSQQLFIQTIFSIFHNAVWEIHLLYGKITVHSLN